MGKRGPQPKDQADKRSAIGIRIPPALLKQLENAKASTGARTLTEEIERRLRDSFAIDQKIEASFHGRRNYWFAQLVADGIANGIESETHEKMWDDPFTYDEAGKFIETLLSLLRPKGKVSVPKHLRQSAADREGIRKRTPGSWALPYERGTIGKLQAFLVLTACQLALRGEQTPKEDIKRNGPFLVSTSPIPASVMLAAMAPDLAPGGKASRLIDAAAANMAAQLAKSGQSPIDYFAPRQTQATAKPDRTVQKNRTVQKRSNP